MKTNKYLILILILAVAIGGCKKKIEPVSKIVDVTYPSIALHGSGVILIPVGGSYTDEGAALTDDITGAVTEITSTSTDLDASTPGFYSLRYEAANTNGFRTEVVRTILVLDYTPVAGLSTTLNLAGTWLRSTGVPVYYTKVAEGLYVMDKVGGSSSVPAYLVSTSDSTIDVPLQISFNGLELECINETIDMSTPDTTITYNVSASGFGTQTRFFTKIQ